jgi:hypothetical protein
MVESRWSRTKTKTDEITISFYNELQYSYSVPFHRPERRSHEQQLKYRWQAAYLSAILEFDSSKIPAKVRKALSSIEDRLKLPLISGSPEYQNISYPRRQVWDNRPQGKHSEDGF